MKAWLTLLALLITTPSLALAADDIKVNDAWVRAAPPGATVLAAYLTIHNKSAGEQVLSGVSSSQFKSVEIHRTEIKDGVASMSAEPRITIPAQGTVTFAPNGYHLMLIGPRESLRVGDHVELSLQFDGQLALLVYAPIRADAEPAADVPHHNHQH